MLGGGEGLGAEGGEPVSPAVGDAEAGDAEASAAVFTGHSLAVDCME